MKKDGFAVIMVFICLSIFLIIGLTLYQTTLFTPDYLNQRVQRRAHQLLLEGAVAYTLAFCKENWQRLVFFAKNNEKEESFILSFNESNAQVLVTIELGREKQIIELQLLKANKEVDQLKVAIKDGSLVEYL